MTIDIDFNVYSDANGGDPDSTSPTLKKYHEPTNLIIIIYQNTCLFYSITSGVLEFKVIRSVDLDRTAL